MNFVSNFIISFSNRYVELLRYGVKSWSDKRRRVDYHNNGGQKDGGGGWSSTTTALPSLSTTLPRPRFQSSIGPGSLPDFEPAVSIILFSRIL